MTVESLRILCLWRVEHSSKNPGLMCNCTTNV
jgi:hypothetical protein